jgi:hypothetical protein
MAVRNIRLHQKLHSGLTLDGGRIEEPGTAAKPTINLLKGDDIGAELANHPDDAIGPRSAVHASTFVDVVGCNLQERPQFDPLSYIGHREPRRRVPKLHWQWALVDFLECNRLNAAGVDHSSELSG